jgi:hypothetical protein
LAAAATNTLIIQVTSEDKTMPFTVNVGPYQGGNFLFQGLSNLGQGVGGGIASASELLRKQKEEQGQSDTIFEEYLKSNKFSDDPAANKEMAAKEALKFHDLSPSAKKGVAAGIIQNWLQKYHVEQIKSMQSEATARTSEAALRTQQVAKMAQEMGAAKADEPYAHTGIWTTDADGNPVQVGVYGGTGGDVHMFPGAVVKSEKDQATTGEPNVSVVRDPETKEVIGRSVQYPGTKQRDFIPKQPEESIRKNPLSGQLENWNGRAWVPLPAPLQQQYRFFGPGGLANPEATPDAKPSATPTDPKRAQAVAALQAKGYPTTEANIKALMGQIK